MVCKWKALTFEAAEKRAIKMLKITKKDDKIARELLKKLWTAKHLIDHFFELLEAYGFGRAIHATLGGEKEFNISTEDFKDHAKALCEALNKCFKAEVDRVKDLGAIQGVLDMSWELAMRMVTKVGQLRQAYSNEGNLKKIEYETEKIIEFLKTLRTDEQLLYRNQLTFAVKLKTMERMLLFVHSKEQAEEIHRIIDDLKDTAQDEIRNCEGILTWFKRLEGAEITEEHLLKKEMYVFKFGKI